MPKSVKTARPTSATAGSDSPPSARHIASVAEQQEKRRRGSKQSRVIAMLNQPMGTTIAAMMKATGWQQHSVRGFLAGVVRKKLKLKLNSKKVDGKRVYRIVGRTAAARAAGNPSAASA